MDKRKNHKPWNLIIVNKYSQLLITLFIIILFTYNVSGAECVGAGCDSNMTITIVDTTNPTWDNPRNFTNDVNTSFSELFTASDVGGISYYWLNDTSVFNISQTGIITNVSNLDSINIYNLNISVNDTAGNIASIVIWINITEPSFTLRIISPTNITYNYIDIDLLVSAGGYIDSYWYKLNNGNNITFIPNVTLNNLEWEQYHTLQVWVNDTDGNILTEIRRFYIGDTSSNYLMYYLLVLILGSLLLILGYNKLDPRLILLSGFLFSAFSITYAFNGYPSIESDFLNMFIITISAGFSFYLITLASLKFIREGF